MGNGPKIICGLWDGAPGGKGPGVVLLLYVNFEIV